MAGWTNKGKWEAVSLMYRNVTRCTNYYIILFTDASAPVADTNTESDLTEIADGSGYTTGGYQLTPGDTDFDVATEDDTNDRGLVQVKDVVWTASGGTIPDSGDGARYAMITDDNGTIASREAYQYWDLTSARSISDGQTLTLQNLEIRINES